jgi:hypothetical protein
LSAAATASARSGATEPRTPSAHNGKKLLAASRALRRTTHVPPPLPPPPLLPLSPLAAGPTMSRSRHCPAASSHMSASMAAARAAAAAAKRAASACSASRSLQAAPRAAAPLAPEEAPADADAAEAAAGAGAEAEAACGGGGGGRSCEGSTETEGAAVARVVAWTPCLRACQSCTRPDAARAPSSASSASGLRECGTRQRDLLGWRRQ